MNRATFIFLVCGSAFALSLGAQSSDVRQLTEESRKVADQLVSQIRIELMKAMETSGPLRSIIVCKYSVPEIASSLSRKTGWKVSRVALKPRNPALGMPDAWEQKVLADFEARITRGEKPDALEHTEIVAEGRQRYFRYMKALPMQPFCSACHGPADQLSPAVKAQLAVEYPHDQATGYRPGQARGAVTVKRPLD